MRHPLLQDNMFKNIKQSLDFPKSVLYYVKSFSNFMTNNKLNIYKVTLPDYSPTYNSFFQERPDKDISENHPVRVVDIVIA